MAYVRNSLVEHRLTNSISNDSDTKVCHDYNDEFQKKPGGHKSQKQLVIFTFNISFLSPFLRYMVLAFGMFFFMCLYGYFQELVVYGWFDRKLSLFCTFLHFLGCSFFAQLQYHYTGRSSSASTSMLKNESGTKSHSLPGLSPSSHISAKIHSLSSTLIVSNMSMSNDKSMRGKLLSIISILKNIIMRFQVRQLYFCIARLLFFLRRILEFSALMFYFLSTRDSMLSLKFPCCTLQCCDTYLTM